MSGIKQLDPAGAQSLPSDRQIQTLVAVAHSRTEWPHDRHNGAQFKKQLRTGHFVIQNITEGLISVLNKLTGDLCPDKIQNL